MVDGLKLKTLREEAGLTLQELGDSVGVTNSMIAHMERGLKTPSVEVMVRIAKCLGTTLDELVKEK